MRAILEGIVEHLKEEGIIHFPSPSWNHPHYSREAVEYNPCEARFLREAAGGLHMPYYSITLEDRPKLGLAIMLRYQSGWQSFLLPGEKGPTFLGEHPKRLIMCSFPLSDPDSLGHLTTKVRTMGEDQRDKVCVSCGSPCPDGCELDDCCFFEGWGEWQPQPSRGRGAIVESGESCGRRDGVTLADPGVLSEGGTPAYVAVLCRYQTKATLVKLGIACDI